MTPTELSQTELISAVQELAVASSLDGLRDVLARYPVLYSTEMDRQLTRAIQAGLQRNAIATISVLFIVRGFLAHLRRSSLESALDAMGGIPLYRADPIGQLIRDPQPSPHQVALCYRALEIVRRDTEPDLWAYLHFLLANRLMLAGQDQTFHTNRQRDPHFLPTDRLMPDRTPTNIQEAMDAYKVAGDVWDTCQQFEQAAQARYELARLLIDFTTGNQRAAALQRAIELLEFTSTIWTHDTHPQEWGDVQVALGLALENMPDLDADTLEQAIGHYENALPNDPSLNPSFELARRQYHLAILYAQRYRGDRVASVERAIELLQATLEVQTRDAYPEEWADTQNGLANALQQRLRGDPAQNIEGAIEAYQDALKVWTCDRNPTRWAMIQRNLAEAYRHRILGRPEENQEAVIAYFREALTIYTRQEHPIQWASVHNSLANLYCNRLRDNRADNIETGIQYYKQALNVYTRDAYPRQWAQTMNNLANAYCERADDNHADNLRTAIALYEQVLEVRTCDVYPREWAATHNNIGTAYSDLHQWEQAVKYFQKALDIRTVDALPDKALQTARNLGALHFGLGEWDEAIHAYKVAQAASDTLYRQAITEAGKRAEISRGGEATHHIAYALARKGDLTEATLELERGRARLLAETLARDRAVLDHADAQDRTEYEDAVSEIRALESELRAAELNAQGATDGPTTARPFVEIAEDLPSARNRLDEVVKHIRQTEPSFLSEDFDVDALTKSMPPNSALIYVVTTPQGSMALTVPSTAPRTGPSGSTFLDERHVVWLNDFRTGDLHAALLGGFLEGAVAGNIALLQDTLPELLLTLGARLMHPLAERLRELAFKRVILVPAGLLALLPLQAASLEDSTFQDEFEVTYTPSARALGASQSALESVADCPATCLAIGNPLPVDKPLAWARAEVEEIATLFRPEQCKLLLENKAKLSTVQDDLPNYTYIHFACHGLFDPNRPLASGLVMTHEELLTLLSVLDETRLKATRLAVLSACQTAITDFQHVPDEAFGLPAGFLQAGVPGVVGSLWPVDDPTTTLLMGRFYHNHLKESMSPATALCEAQRWLRDLPLGEVMNRLEEMRKALVEKKDRRQFVVEVYQNKLQEENDDDLQSKPFAHPYYWAAFTMNGV